MKADIHPSSQKATFRCQCGYSSEILSTKTNTDSISVEICSQCHPFYTGQQRFVDTAGRIDRFRKKYGGLDSLKKKKKG